MEPQGSILLCQGLETSGLENSLAGEVQFFLRLPAHPQHWSQTFTECLLLAQHDFLVSPPRSTLCERPTKVIGRGGLFSGNILSKPETRWEE